MNFFVPKNPREEQVSDGSYYRGITLHQGLVFPRALTFGFAPAAAPSPRRVRLWINYPDGGPVTEWQTGTGTFTFAVPALPTHYKGARISEYSAWAEIDHLGAAPIASCGMVFTSGPPPARGEPCWCWPTPTAYDFEWTGLRATMPPRPRYYDGRLPSWPLGVHFTANAAAPFDPKTTPSTQLWVERMGPAVDKGLVREFCETASGHITTAVLQDYAHADRASGRVRMTDGPMGHLGHAWVLAKEAEDATGKATWFLSVNGALGVQHGDRRRVTVAGWHSPVKTVVPPAGAATPLTLQPTRLPYYYGDAFKPGMLHLEGDWSRCTGPKSGFNKPWGFALRPRDPGFGHACRGAVADTHNNRIVHFDHRPAHAGDACVLTDTPVPAPDSRPWGLARWREWWIFTCKNSHAILGMHQDTHEVVTIKRSVRAWAYADLATGMHEDFYPHGHVVPSDIRKRLFGIPRPVINPDGTTTTIEYDPADGSRFAFPTDCHFHPDKPDELWVMHEYSGWIWKLTIAPGAGGKPTAASYVPGPALWKDGAADFREMAFGLGKIGARVVLVCAAWGQMTDHVYDATTGEWLNMMLRSQTKGSADKFMAFGPMEYVTDPAYPAGVAVGPNYYELKPVGSTNGILRIRKRLPTDPVVDRAKYQRGQALFKWHGFTLAYGEDCQGYYGQRPPAAELDALLLTAADRAAMEHYLDVVTAPNVVSTAVPPTSDTTAPPPPSIRFGAITPA